MIRRQKFEEKCKKLNNLRNEKRTENMNLHTRNYNNNRENINPKNTIEQSIQQNHVFLPTLN